MSDSAKPIQMHKAGVPSSASPLRDRPSFVIPSPAPAAPGDLKPPDWDGWIERARLLGHSLENLNAPENGIRQPSVQRFVRPTVKAGHGLGVVQLGRKDKARKKAKEQKAAIKAAKKTEHLAAKKDEAHAPKKDEAPAAKKDEPAAKKDEPQAAAAAPPPGAAAIPVPALEVTPAPAMNLAPAALAAKVEPSPAPKKLTRKQIARKKVHERQMSKMKQASAKSSKEKDLDAPAPAAAKVESKFESFDEILAKVTPGIAAHKQQVEEKRKDDEKNEKVRERRAEDQEKSLIGFDLDEIPDLAESSSVLAQLQKHGDESDISPEFIEELVSELSQAKQIELRTNPGTGRGSKVDWASKQVRQAGKAMAGDKEARAGQTRLFPGGQYGIHHKISKSKLKRLDAAREEAKGAAAPLNSFLDTLGGTVGAQGRKKILLNMPANLEMGPPTDQRSDDPGEKFDANYLESGEMTPRSAILSKIDDIDFGPKTDWVELTKKLERVHGMHQKKLEKGQLLSAPGRWDFKANRYKKKTRS